MSFTLFVILPNQDVCSLRNLASGTSIKAIRKNLELSAGLPAQTYRLTCPEGQVLHEDHVLKMDVNVWDGYVVRAVFLDSWQELYDHIVANDVNHVIKHGAVYMRGDVVWMDGEEEKRAREVMKERGVVALYVASFLGMPQMCKALLSVDVNPNGKTPFGRTPLFAAMSRDNDHVMELLLSYNALLESRDVDGVTAVEVARRVTATQCVRKVRHLQLQSKGDHSSPSVPGSPAVTRRRGPRIIRIQSGAVVQRDSSYSSTSHGRSRTSREETADRSVTLTSDNDAYRKTKDQVEGKPLPQTQPQLLVAKHSRIPQPQPLFRQDKEGELYAWENNLSHASRAPSAAGTHMRLSLTSSSGSHIVNRNGGSRSNSSKGQAITWSDTVSVTSNAPRMLPFRPTVQEITIKGPSSVLTTSSTTSLPTQSSVTLHSLHPEHPGVVKQKRPIGLVKFFDQSPHSRESSSSARPHSQQHHFPAQEPPGRPPTRVESRLLRSEGEDHHTGGCVGNSCLMGSQDALSVGSAPELGTTTGTNTEVGAEARDVDHGESDDDGGRVLTSRGKSSRTSNRFRTRMLVSRQKQQESWKTMKRRIRLAEEQKRNSTTKPQHNSKSDKDTKETFEHWLDRKRREQYSTDDDTSEDDDDRMTLSVDNPEAINNWLRDAKERPVRPQTSSPILFHRRKTRPVKNVVQTGGNTNSVGSRGDNTTATAAAQASCDSDLTAYRQWQHRKNRVPTSGGQSSIQDIEEAKKQVEEKRKSLLAMALTYQDWMEHTEERKKLMQAILRADVDKLAAIEQHYFQTQRAPRQITFNEWREKVDKREAEIRQRRHLMRKEAEFRHQNGLVGDEFMRSGAAIAHEEWLKQKREAALKQTDKAARSAEMDADSVAVSEDEKERALEEWLEQKHKHEMAQLEQHLRQERQLLFRIRQKKPPTVTPC